MKKVFQHFKELWHYLIDDPSIMVLFAIVFVTDTIVNLVGLQRLLKLWWGIEVSKGVSFLLSPVVAFALVSLIIFSLFLYIGVITLICQLTFPRFDEKMKDHYALLDQFIDVLDFEKENLDNYLVKKEMTLNRTLYRDLSDLVDTRIFVRKTGCNEVVYQRLLIRQKNIPHVVSTLETLIGKSN